MPNKTRTESSHSGSDDLDPSLVNIRNHLKDHYGIHFKFEKLYSLEHKLKRRLKVLSLENYSEYETYLKNNTDEINYLLDEVSTNKTAFFREPKHWDFLIEDLFPKWHTEKDTIKAWTVPCSSGEEPYSLAMVADDYYHHGNQSQRPSKAPSIDILASDVSRQVLVEARRGQYDEKRLRQVRDFNKDYPKRYFQRDENGGYVIDQQIKNKVTLRTFNLNMEKYPLEQAFDLIMCRNVLIYFDNDVITHVIDQLTKCLKPGGYLFIGHTESLYDIEHQLEKIRPATFQKTVT